MINPTAPLAKRGGCTVPFSLHLTLTILGLVGLVLSIIVCAIIIFTLGEVWALISSCLVFASGLQGLLVVAGSSCFNCHVVLAVVNLVNLVVFGVACIFLASPFWIIWVVAAFVIELWVTIIRFCGKTVGGGGFTATELPTAQPRPAQGIPTYDTDPRYDDGFKQPY